MPSFRLTTILWAFALLAAGLSAFGTIGFFAALGVLLFWARVFEKTRLTVVELLTILTIILVIIALLLPAVQAARESARQAQCLNHLMQITKALMLWPKDNHGALPAAAAGAAPSDPPRSWRLLILPWLDERALYSSYHSDRPWDDSSNGAVAQASLNLFTCPSDPPIRPHTMTANYFAVVGPHTAWPADRGRALAEITDKPSQTILLIEAAERDVPWSKPEDLTVDEAVRLLTDPDASAVHHYRQPDTHFFYVYPEGSGLHVAFADGTVRFLPVPISKELAVAMLTVDGGEPIDQREFDRVTLPRFDYARAYSLAMFILLAVLPGFYLRQRPANGRS